jgi:CheY-like chemotaxis protein
VDEGKLLMTQAERDWLVALKKAKKRLITQKEAALELGVTERHVRRLLKSLKRRGDKAVIHALRGQKSNRRIEEEIRQNATKILSQEVYRGFGPTLASEYLAKKHAVKVSRETVRKWMIEAKLWRPRKEKVGKVHQWRPRRSRFGDLLQWDTSDHAWLEGRGEEMKLILLIDDATSKWFARFVRSDSTAENMEVFERYLKKWGRPLACYTDKASLFQTAVKTKRDQQRQQKDQPEMPPTQIARALKELDITWIAAHSPQAKGRVERGFSTAQDRLVKGLRVAGVSTRNQANDYLEKEFLPWVNETLSVTPANADDAHRPLEKHHNLAAILSHVESRRVSNDYTIQFESEVYQIASKDVGAGLRGGDVQVEKRRDGSIAVRFRSRYLAVSRCELRPKQAKPKPAKKPGPTIAARKPSNWNKNFNLQKSMPLWKAANSSGARPQELP